MAIENLKKHVGILKNTGVRIAVVFRKLPTDDTHCLVVETERLPDSYHDNLQQVLNSKEAKDTNDLFEVLNRRTFPDGTNCLTSLHQRGLMRKEPVTNITMMPLPGQSVPLELINATIDKTVDKYRESHTEDGSVKEVEADVAVEVQDGPTIAKGLILQAELLEKDALAKREEAYTLAPELKPGRGRPQTPEELKAQKAEERKIKRRERDRKKAAEAKALKAESAIDKKIAAKIERDTRRANDL